MFYRSYKIPFSSRSGLVSAPILGFMFGLGWTPCIGPTLGAVQALALNEASAARGAFLSLIYSLGLGLPFIFFALFMDKSRRLKRAIAGRGRLVSLFGGIFLIAIGLLQVLGIWETLMADLRGTITNFVPVI
jgi:cytochrome c-type biogenesis protein